MPTRTVDTDYPLRVSVSVSFGILILHAWYRHVPIGDWWSDEQEVVIGEEAAASGENVFVGGENRWK